MKSVRFLKFFEIQQSSFVIFLSFLDIVVFSVNFIINYLSVDEKNINMLLTSMIFIDSIMITITITSLIYFLINKRFISMINIFYLWTRFIIYCFYFLFSFVLLSLMIYKTQFELQENENSYSYFYFLGIFFMISFCFLNINWCFALKTIMNNDNVLNEDEKSNEISCENENVTVSEF